VDDGVGLGMGQQGWYVRDMPKRCRVQQPKAFAGGQWSSQQAEVGLGGARAAGRERD
jgi:hypothetical protein